LNDSHRPRVHLPEAIGLLGSALHQFARACRRQKAVHFEEPELVSGFETLARLEAWLHTQILHRSTYTLVVPN
jgi:hypothetical protein